MDNENNELLDKDKLKKTKARQSILSLLKNCEPKTVDELYNLTQAQNEKFSISTIYRTCETLAQKGILLKSTLMTDGKARYEFHCDEHRHHAVCMDCHKIIPIDDCPFGDFSELMKSKYDFDVQSHRIEILGYCQDCRANHEDNGKK